METRELIDASYTIYGEMEEIYIKLNGLDLAETTTTLLLMKELEALRRKVQSLDSSIINVLRQQRSHSQEIRRKLAKRDSRIRRMLELNREISEKAACHRALVQSERASLHHGQTALHGYKAAVGDY